MTSSLRVRLHAEVGAAAIAMGAVANVYALDEAGKRDSRRDRRNVVIPAGSSAKPLIIEVEPGQYLVEAVLPAGDVTSVQVRVDEGADVGVDLKAPGVRDVWLGWQRYLGNVPLRRRLSSSDRPAVAPVRLEPPSRRAGASLMDEWSAARLAAGPTDRGPTPVGTSEPIRTVHLIDHPVPALSGREGPHEDAWALLEAENVRRDPVAALAVEPASVVAPMPVEFRFKHANVVMNLGPASDDEQDLALLADDSGPTPRRYVISQSTSGIIELACVPLPWNTEAFGRVPVELLVRNHPLPGEAVLSMSPRDPEIGPALGYMASGSLVNARVMFEQARDLLFGKFRNPLAASAGGYVLVATDPGGQAEAWRHWVHNLAEWFPWLPDGAIQHGRLLLRHRQGKEDVDLARTVLFAAYDRGLPFYSLGLQWLIDGLSLLAARDGEARRRLARVQAVGWRTNYQQAFTTIRLTDP
jgi:hypothetical protein